ncbi:FHA domain protein [Gregarina niphandrodes]|uniref:FHA domain protein n=1 Tax=Gregarina niphandrodes TaxID=110365 RepID=A0A023BBZ3_GRENI|nr:FHA domain protein [Gregarina niphandrodes]EZG80327.1 FHA domain protein [Gregarina niphandrodes]|eukprot:XP_011134301.1 FHA domain protein [Gregarina niphandrodes]
MTAVKRRRWFPAKEAKFSEQEVVQYYVKSPPCFYLTLLVAAKNVPLSPDENCEYMIDPIKKEAQAILERECPNKLYPPELYEGPGIVSLGQPLLVKIHPNVPFEFVIGRSQQNLEAVPGAARRWFSRRHCAIQVYFGKRGKAGQVVFAVKDLRSANGTFLNGKALPSGGAAALMNNDIIGVSMTDYGGLMLGFRFTVLYISERRWVAIHEKVSLLDDDNEDDDD